MTFDTFEIRRVAVIGAGVMGGGIAAHVANAGVPVLLLDMPQPGWGKKNSLAEDAIKRMLKTDPAPFMSLAAAELITPGNLEDDLEKVKGCDWVIEAVVEKLDIKQHLYARLENVIGPTTLVSSNTSTIPLHKLVEGRSRDFQKNFAVTHFFNPPRYMRLVELARGSETSQESIDALQNFCDLKLGKGVVLCRDTPGFIGNRIGMFWLQTAMLEAIDRGMSVEEADALFGRPMGIPKTGVFGLMDLVGLDLIPLIGRSMTATLPPQDPYYRRYREPDILKKMIAAGYTGRKGKGGFYRFNPESGTKIKESINLQTGEYHPSYPLKLPAFHPLHALSVSGTQDTLRALLTFPDRSGQYAWKVLSEVLVYAASLTPEISDHIVGVDRAMKLGYNWQYGPFELIDQMGARWFADKLREEGRIVPSLLAKVGDGGQGSDAFYRVQEGRLQYFTFEGTYEDVPRRPGQLLLSDVKRRSKPVIKNDSASLWDIGDQVACLEFHTKTNTIDARIMAMIRQSMEIVGREFKALVIYNEGTNFSAGANIETFLVAAKAARWSLIEQMITEGQKTYQALKYAPFPVVSAPSGMALGGGCEILLHSSAIQAHAESRIGLVEAGVGLVPAWGGCKEMLTRWMNAYQHSGGALVAIRKVFEMIGTAKAAKSAAEAKELLYLGAGDGITMNRDRLLADAKAKALSLAKDYKPPEPQELSLPGKTAREALSLAVKTLIKAGKASPYDKEVSRKLAFVLTGGDTDVTDKQTEDHLYKLERNAFMLLIKNPETLARIEYMLEAGKPLRN